MMKLTIDSMCLISSIVDKVQIDDKFIQEMINLGKTAKGKNKAEVENLQKQIGMKIILKIGSKIHLAKTELIDFISSYKSISKEDAEKEDMIGFIKEIMGDENFISFFKSTAMSK